MMNKILTTLLLTTITLSAQTSITVNPGIKYQTVDGWGGSLCWWANICGGHSDSKTDLLADWITNPAHLNMNIFRFNIGGGDNPEHDHMRGDGGEMPGYKIYENANYDWTQDANQRNMLQKLISARLENLGGESDIKLVAFCNSPPWWMTKSGCSSGAETSQTTNLKDDMYDDFANYITDVVQYYHDSLGITFNHLEPFNEPDGGWWTAYGNQEGCYFTVSNQMKLIREVYAALETKNMLSYCTLTGSDWNNMSNGVSALNNYISAGDIMTKISQIDCHSYFGSNQNRRDLATISDQQNKKLWQSESGPLNVGNSANYQIMHIAQRIITDMRIMKPEAWIDWQIVADGSIQWGLLDGKYSYPSGSYVKNISFYIRAQYTRFIKTGYDIIESSQWNTLAAISPEEDEIVLVICNTDTTGKAENISFDLSNFDIGGGIPYSYITKIDGSKKNYRSFVTIDDKKITYSAPAQSVTTFVIPITGIYTPPIQNSILANFEDINGFADIGFHSTFSGTYPDAPNPHETWHIVYDSIAENPKKIINTTDNTYLVRQENSDWWGNFLNFRIAETGQGITVGENNRYLHVFHYRETIQDGWSLYLNKETNHSDSEIGKLRFDGNNATASVWEDLVFDLNELISKDQTLDVFTFCVNTDYTAPKEHPMSDFAFDEIILSNSSTPRTDISAIKQYQISKSLINHSYSNNTLRIWTSDDTLIKKITLYNIKGLAVASIQDRNTAFELINLKPGIYIANIESEQSRQNIKIAIF